MSDISLSSPQASLPFNVHYGNPLIFDVNLLICQSLHSNRTCFVVVKGFRKSQVIYVKAK